MFNESAFNPAVLQDPNFVCTLDTCPLAYAQVTYQPTLPGNALFLAIFAVLLFVQLWLGIRHKTWSFMAAMLLGLFTEIIGYIGRVLLHTDPFNFNYFVQYLVCLTIAPAFLTAALYITFSRVAYSCDESISYIRPKILSIIFMTCDFICLVLQAAGGAITATTNGQDQSAINTRQMGINTMIAGLAFQVVSLAAFMAYAAAYAWRWRAAKALHHHSQVKSTRKWTLFIFGLVVASITIWIRCIFRVAELSNGFSSALANNEIAYMILEGAMIIIACLCLTAFHPGLCLDIAWKLPKRGSRKVEGPSSEDVNMENVRMDQK